MYIIVFITTSSKEEAEKIATMIVNEGLAACVNIIEKVTSIYKWKGNLEKDTESLLIVKTKEEKLSQLISKVKKEHSYENPEIISINITGGSEEYLEWISNCVER